MTQSANNAFSAEWLRAQHAEARRRALLRQEVWIRQHEEQRQSGGCPPQRAARLLVAEAARRDALHIRALHLQLRAVLHAAAAVGYHPPSAQAPATATAPASRPRKARPSTTDPLTAFREYWSLLMQRADEVAHINAPRDHIEIPWSGFGSLELAATVLAQVRKATILALRKVRQGVPEPLITAVSDLLAGIVVEVPSVEVNLFESPAVVCIGALGDFVNAPIRAALLVLRRLQSILQDAASCGTLFAFSTQNNSSTTTPLSSLETLLSALRHLDIALASFSKDGLCPT